MAESNLVVKVTADTQEFRRDVKRVCRWLHWRLLAPAFVYGFVGGVVAIVVERVFA